MYRVKAATRRRSVALFSPSWEPYIFLLSARLQMRESTTRADWGLPTHFSACVNSHMQNQSWAMRTHCMCLCIKSSYPWKVQGRTICKLKGRRLPEVGPTHVLVPWKLPLRAPWQWARLLWAVQRLLPSSSLDITVLCFLQEVACRPFRAVWCAGRADCPVYLVPAGPFSVPGAAWLHQRRTGQGTEGGRASLRPACLFGGLFTWFTSQPGHRVGDRALETTPRLAGPATWELGFRLSAMKWDRLFKGILCLQRKKNFKLHTSEKLGWICIQDLCTPFSGPCSLWKRAEKDATHTLISPLKCRLILIKSIVSRKDRLKAHVDVDVSQSHKNFCVVVTSWFLRILGLHSRPLCCIF